MDCYNFINDYCDLNCDLFLKLSQTDTDKDNEVDYSKLFNMFPLASIINQIILYSNQNHPTLSSYCTLHSLLEHKFSYLRKLT